MLPFFYIVDLLESLVALYKSVLYTFIIHSNLSCQSVELDVHFSCPVQCWSQILKHLSWGSCLFPDLPKTTSISYFCSSCFFVFELFSPMSNLFSAVDNLIWISLRLTLHETAVIFSRLVFKIYPFLFSSYCLPFSCTTVYCNYQNPTIHCYPEGDGFHFCLVLLNISSLSCLRDHDLSREQAWETIYCAFFPSILLDG